MQDGALIAEFFEQNASNQERTVGGRSFNDLLVELMRLDVNHLKIGEALRMEFIEQYSSVIGKRAHRIA
ncbi:hypothetical protein IAI22_11200, partial [Streptococcus pseudopneumoniae]|uniref:hypothetical protein n=1 Tax=Streptococcus pseudopneumoniae TaxID=257758 RepID=UPI0018B04526